jgi:hypothetical protein
MTVSELQTTIELHFAAGPSAMLSLKIDTGTAQFYSRRSIRMV